MSNRINLTKYGFIRCPEEDFSDDGTRFYVFKCGYLRVTKAADKFNNIYISASVIGSLSYDEYSKITFYSYLDALNGVGKNQVTDECLAVSVESWFNYLKLYKEKVFKKQNGFDAFVINKIGLVTLNECDGKFFINDGKGNVTTYTDYMIACNKFIELTK